MTERAFGCVVVLIATVSTPFTAHISPLTLQDTTAGKKVYVKWCAGCHGDGGAGDGAGAAYMLPRPRNFTGGLYKIRTTASGQLPTDADPLRAIDEGLAGSAMPGGEGRVSQPARGGGVGGRARARPTCCRAPATSPAGSTRFARRRAASSRPTRTCCGRSTRGSPAARCPGGRGGSLSPSGAM